MITGKINVKLIKKEKLFEGEKGTYLNFVLIETPNSKYGDYMIKQEGKQEEDMPILGNAKIWNAKSKSGKLAPETEKFINDDPLPF